MHRSARTKKTQFQPPKTIQVLVSLFWASPEDDPRKEWKVLVAFSVTPVPMEHSSDLRAENKVLTDRELSYPTMNIDR